MAAGETIHSYQIGIRHFQIVVVGEQTFGVARIEEVIGDPENPDSLVLLDQPAPKYATTEQAAVVFGQQRCRELIGERG